MPELRGTITLTAQEQELFTELLESSNQAGLATTTLRCAGGWVRDKLMGRESLDIDIALDNMMGKEFAERVNSYLESRGKETHNVAVIMSNPDQSKHLETARMKIRGLWIDLVNLRSEEYAHNSRIPTMTFGTPEQDAFRRDFTINSLFYNINTKEVEDYTGKGIEDMKLGVIRTPLPAKETFLDDPLRVLRAVRFASRFGFALDESLVEAASDDKVRCVVICDLCSFLFFVGFGLGVEIRGSERKGSCRGWQPNWSALTETTPSRDDLLVFQRRFHGGMKGNEEKIEEEIMAWLPSPACTAGGRPCASRRRR